MGLRKLKTDEFGTWYLFVYWESSTEVHEEKRAKTATFKISFELRVMAQRG